MLDLAKVKEAVSEAIGEKTQEIESKIVAGVDSKIAEKIGPIEARLEGLEKLPATHKPSPIVASMSRIYKGYNLSDQGRDTGLRSKVKGDPSRFRVLSNDEHFEKYAEFMLDVKDALRGDLEAVRKLREAQQKSSALTTQTANLGGYAVPEDFQADLIEMAKDKSFALQECSVFTMSALKMPFPSEASRVISYWVAENTANSNTTNPTFGEVELEAKKLFGLTDYVSQELLSDSAIDIVGMLTDQFAYGQALELDNQFLNGTGDPCSGVLTAAAGYSVVMTLTDFSSISASDLSLMISKLSDSDEDNAKFVFNKLILHYLRQLKDDNNHPIYQKPSEKTPGTIYEIPYIRSAKAPSTTGTSTAFAVLGDLKKFYIGRRKGDMTIDIDPYTGFNAAKIRYRMITRWGLGIARSSAFVRLVTGS